MLRAVTNNATSSRPGLLDGHRGRQCRCAQRGPGKGRATRRDRRTRHMVLWPTGRSIGLRMGLQVQVLPRPLLPVRSSAHGCLSGYGVSEPLGSVTELEPRQTQQFRICLMGSPADGMLWPPWLIWSLGGACASWACGRGFGSASGSRMWGMIHKRCMRDPAQCARRMSRAEPLWAEALLGPVHSPWRAFSGSPIKFNRHEDSHPSEFEVCLSQTF